MFDFFQFIAEAITDSFQASNSNMEEQSSIGDWMVYASVPIVAGTDNIGSLFHDENACRENFSFNIN
jgi:hypothetical protein